MNTYSPTQLRFPLGWKTALTITSLLLIIGFASPVAHASGGATKIDFEAEELLFPIGPPERVWMSGDVQHIRNFPLAGPVWGDINGTLTTSFNINQNVITGDGTAFGTFSFAVEWNGLVGTFEGRAHAKYEAFIIDGQGSGHGTGDFEGMQFHARFFEVDGHTLLVGTIMIPGGN